MAIKFFAFSFPTISTFGCFWSQWPTSLAVTSGCPTMRCGRLPSRSDVNIHKISIEMGSPHLFGLARLQGVHHFIVDLGVGIKLCLQNSLPKKLGFIGFMLLDWWCLMMNYDDLCTQQQVTSGWLDGWMDGTVSAEPPAFPPSEQWPCRFHHLQRRGWRHRERPSREVQ